VIPVCLTVAVVVLGAYALTWQTMVWRREDDRRLEALEENEKIRCSALKSGRYGNGQATIRCELDEDHHGPHTAKLEGYMREHWK